MAWSKFDPHAAPVSDEHASASAARRARLLRYGWLITMIYTAIGFGFLAVFYVWGNPF